MMNPESKRPVTVEDLIRLKRAERPAPEFWARFEQELRAKQLAAIVDRRPWWKTMPRLLGSLKRYQFPLGASAVLAVTFISVHHYQSSARLPQPGVPSAAPVEEMIVASNAAADVAPVKSEADSFDLKAAIASVAMENSAPAGRADASNVRADAVAPGRLTEVLPWTVGTPVADADASGMPAMPSLVAANMEAVKATHPELARKYLGRAAGYEVSELDRKPAVDPFTRLRGPADIKRDRLLAKALPASVSTTWTSGERIAHRLSEQRLTEEAISRLDAAGDRLSLKF